MQEYLMKKIAKSNNMNALFFNKIDNFKRSKEEEFLINGETILPEFEGDDSVRYYFNSLGFRSDEFTKTHKGTHVLFAGCSETEGFGGNLEFSWPHMVYTELCKTEKLSGFFNLSRGGWGNEIIIANIIQYINRYGKPDKIYMLLPNLSRIFEYVGQSENLEKYRHIQLTPYWSKKDLKELNGENRKRQTIEHQRGMIPSFIILIKLFEEYCMSNSIELRWATWSQEDGKNYKNLNVFNSFITLPDDGDVFLESKTFTTSDELKKKYLLKKRDGHHGYLYHHIWSQRFLGQTDHKDKA
jgi:hypothetical protein